VFVIVGVMGLITLDVFVTGLTMHHAFADGADNCATNCSCSRTDGSCTYSADGTASDRSGRGGTACCCMLLVVLRDLAVVIPTCCARIHVALL
jgi:hypothetical protein